MKQLKQLIKKISADLFTETAAHRHHLHQHPELSFHEFKTADYVEEQLKATGLSRIKRISKTGVVALLKDTTEGPVAGLRADLDALPITEKNTHNYVSVHPGVMHACGHDVHTASLLSTAKILMQLRDSVPGNVKFIFQPGEEKLPGGASIMIAEGVLDDPKIDFMLAQHVTPQIEQGEVGFKPGLFMASTDEIYVTITGKGGHAAMPESFNNPVKAAARLILECEDVFESRLHEINPENIPTVLSFGKIIANGATNVIPEEARLEGTFRTLNEIHREKCHKILMETGINLSAKYDIKIDIDIKKGYPCLINDKEITKSCMHYAGQFLGEKCTYEIPHRMTAEDFAYFSHKVPSCFYRLGTGNRQKNIFRNVHHPEFDIDEDVMAMAPGLMAWLTVCQLKSRICY